MMGDLRGNSTLEPDMNREVEFLFDDGSPFSYLANLQIEGFAKRNGAAVTYTPILLGAVLKATGNASPMTVSAKGRYLATESSGSMVIVEVNRRRAEVSGAAELGHRVHLGCTQRG
jgi:2-hydroxychromene-2-carboxylate isomerase